MNSYPKIFIIGAGAVGLPLAAYLAARGRSVLVLRARPTSTGRETIRVTVRHGVDGRLDVPLETAALAEVSDLSGLVVVTAKAYANAAIASALAKREFAGPLVLLQNGLGVETPFLETKIADIFRGVLYMSSQVAADREVTFRQITSCPIGPVNGVGAGLETCVRALTTPEFRFHAEPDIQREIWKKTMINAVFNSICPLLEVDNGVFARDSEAARLASEIIRECVALAHSHGVALTEEEVMEQAMKISQGAQGVLISTLQDLNHGRETEIESLNLEMARLAAAAEPAIALGKTELLGRMILAKSRLKRLAA